jgi:hypothetical protein
VPRANKIANVISIQENVPLLGLSGTKLPAGVENEGKGQYWRSQVGLTSRTMGKLYSYVVKSDSGFAPNPFWGYCTLACCKPQIRLGASVDDWVIGTGSKSNAGNNKLIYAMKITDKLPFDAYYQDPRFRQKIPSHGLVEEGGDNLYHESKLGAGIQVRPYHHKEEQISHDLSGVYVLISDYFFYFGRNAMQLQDQFYPLIKKGPGHKCRFAVEDIAAFAGWLTANFAPGIHGVPHRFQKISGDYQLEESFSAATAKANTLEGDGAKRA